MSDFPKDCGKSHSTMVGYKVEAMYDNPGPTTIGGQIFDNRWQEVIYVEAKLGVPAVSRFNQEILRHGLIGYEAAQALRWWVHAQAAVEGKGHCLITRLIKHRLITDSTVTAEEAVEETESDMRKSLT